MWTSSLIKQNGKMYLKNNYWFCVAVSIILSACVGGSSGYAGSNASSAVSQSGENIFYGINPAILFAILGVVGIALIFGILADIFLLNPLETGCQKFFITNRTQEHTDLNPLLFPFKNNWINIVVTLLLRDVYLVLWFMLFMIPGFIKAYSYRLVPYIMAEDPYMNPNDAITLSRSMMNGNKWKAFCYDLSFIGWYILVLFTIGILGVFYVFPYKNCSDAELYTAIKENYSPQV